MNITPEKKLDYWGDPMVKCPVCGEVKGKKRLKMYIVAMKDDKHKRSRRLIQTCC